MSASDIVYAIQGIAKAKTHFESFVRDYPNTPLGKNCRVWLKRIQWIESDMLTCPLFDSQTKEAVRGELVSDPYVTDSIMEKIAILTPEQREAIETVVESIGTKSKVTVNVQLQGEDS